MKVFSAMVQSVGVLDPFQPSNSIDIGERIVIIPTERIMNMPIFSINKFVTNFDPLDLKKYL